VQGQAARPAQQRDAPPVAVPSSEPMIGVDIGIPAPSRRINPSPQTQTRSLTVLAVAGVAVILILVLAFVISRLGGGSDSPGAEAATGTGTPGATVTGTAGTAQATATSGIEIAPGIVPDLRGITADRARLAVQEGGWKINELHQKSTVQKNNVIEQSPVPGAQWPEGSIISLVISDGPS
jgi:hypothetical protein